MAMIRMIMRDNKDIQEEIRLCFNKGDKTSFSNKEDSPLVDSSSFILDDGVYKISYSGIGYGVSILRFVRDIALIAYRRHLDKHGLSSCSNMC